MVDTTDLKSVGDSHAGSTPARATSLRDNPLVKLVWEQHMLTIRKAMQSSGLRHGMPDFSKLPEVREARDEWNKFYLWAQDNLK